MSTWPNEAQCISSSLLRGSEIQKPSAPLLSMCLDCFDAQLCPSCTISDSTPKLASLSGCLAELHKLVWEQRFLAGTVKTKCRFSHPNRKHIRRQQSVIWLVPEDWETNLKPPHAEPLWACLVTWYMGGLMVVSSLLFPKTEGWKSVGKPPDSAKNMVKYPWYSACFNMVRQENTERNFPPNTQKCFWFQLKYHRIIPQNVLGWKGP